MLARAIGADLDPVQFLQSNSMASRRYIINAFTVNVVGPPSASTRAQLEQVLGLFEQYDVRATIFIDDEWMHTVGAARLRQLIEGGHEPGVLAPHYSTPLDQLLHLRERAAGAREHLENMLGLPVTGYRSIPPTSGWRSPAMLETLVQVGFHYSSSSYPRPRPAPLLTSRTIRAHRLSTPSGDLWELPLTAWRPLGIGVPSIHVAGGSRWGRLPLWIIERAVDGMNRHGEPALLHADVGEDASGNPLLVRSILEKIEMVFRTYRFGHLREAFASRLTRDADAGQLPTYRTSIVRGEAEEE